MKNLMIVILILIAGCATAPGRPNTLELMDAIKHRGMTADQVNQVYADYEKAKQEYENSTSYKVTLVAVGLAAAAGGMASYGYGGYGYGYRGYYGYGGKTILTTTPIGGGAYQTVIKGY